MITICGLEYVLCVGSRVCHVTDASVRNMAPVSRKRHVSSAVAGQQTDKRVQMEPNNKVEEILQSKKHANAVYDIFEDLQVKSICQSFVLNVDVG